MQARGSGILEKSGVAVKVTEVFTVKGRGTIAIVDTAGLPRGAIKLGVLVHQGERAWKVSGVESAVRGTGPSPTVGLLLAGEGIPEVGELFL